MKRLACIMVSLSLALLPLGPVSASSAAGAGGEAESFVQVMVRMIMNIRGTTLQDDWGLDDSGLTCLAGARLSSGGTYDLDRHFEAGVPYMLLPATDHSAESIALEVRNGGRSIASLTAEPPFGCIVFTPERSGYYRVRLTLRRSRGLSFYWFAILKRGGCGVPIANLVDACDQFIFRSHVLAMAASRQGLKTSFLQGEGSVWGTVLRGTKSRTVSNVDLSNRHSIALATADSRATKLNLCILDDRNRILVSDSAGDSHPAVKYRPSANRRYGVRVENAESSSEALFALFGVIQVHE